MVKNLLPKLLIACLFTGFSLHNKNAYSQPLPVDSKVTIGNLSNGIKYYIRPNNKPEQKVELRLVVNAGSILEDEDQLGLAHFMEHMCFNGTKHFPKNELVDFLQSIGVEFGADLNAYTSFDETVYILPIPTDKPGNLEKGFQVLEDWAHNALITDEEIDNERGVVLEESRMGKGADDRMMKQYLPKLLAGSRYAERLPIGKDEIIKNFEHDAVRRFYRDWYRPDLMSVAVVGDITVDEAKKLIEKHFAGIKGPQNPRERKQFSILPYEEASAMVLTDKEATNYMFQLVHSARKEEKQVTVQDYRKSIVRNLFTSILNQRLQELTQSANPPFVYAYGYVGGWARGYESFSAAAVPSGDIDVAINAVIKEFSKMQKFGFTNSELEIAKRRSISSIERLYNEKNTTESGRLIGEYVRNFLTEEPIPGIEFEYEIYQKSLPTITLEEVNEEAKKWLSLTEDEEFFALITGPDSKQKKLPTDLELVDLVKNAWNQDVTASEEKTIADNLLNNEPVAGKIVSEAIDKDLNSTTYTLSNGVKVTLKKTDFKSDEILLNGLKLGGTLQYPVKDNANAMFATSVVSSMGFGNFSPTDLTNFLAGKTVNLNPSISNINNSFRGSSTVKDFETLLQLLYLQVTAPRVDEDLFKGFISKQKSQLAFLTSNPQYAFVDTLSRVLYNNDERMPIAVPKESDLDKIDLARAVEIYKNEIGNADDFHFFIVGNIDEHTIKPLLEKYIASLPVKGIKPTYKDNGLRPIKGQNKFNFKRGSEQQSLILAQYYGEIEYSEDLALKADFLGEILNIKVIEELREKLGAIYGGGFGAQLSDKPYNQFEISLYLPCGPENVDPLLKAAEEEIAKIVTNGVEEKDLNKVKMAKHEKHRENLKTNNYWVGRLQSILFWERDKQRFLNFNNVVDSITSKDVQEVAQKLFNGQNYFQAVLYPAESN